MDDEQPVQKLLSFPLEKEGYEVVPALDGQEALSRFENERFDLVVLDIMLPKVDGLEVCRRLRAKSSVPIIMLTAKAEEIDKVLGLEIGADDYITKPFSMREFRSRVRAALRRADMSQRDGSDEPLDRGDLHIDLAKRTTELGGEPVQLTYVEFEILAVLARHPGRVYTRDMLLDRIWGDSAFRDQRTIDVHIRHLREKLEPGPAQPRVPAHGARRRLPVQRRMSERRRTEMWQRIWHTSIKNRLTFLFFTITAGAIMVLYFYVVPQLESKLTSQKIDALERDSASYSRPFEQAIGARSPPHSSTR